jgi:hypothetical protein
VQLRELLERVLGRDVVALLELGARDEQLGLDRVPRKRKSDPNEVGVLDALVPVLVRELADRELEVLPRSLCVVGRQVRSGLARGDEDQGERAGDALCSKSRLPNLSARPRTCQRGAEGSGAQLTAGNKPASAVR